VYARVSIRECLCIQRSSVLYACVFACKTREIDEHDREVVYDMCAPCTLSAYDILRIIIRARCSRELPRSWNIISDAARISRSRDCEIYRRRRYGVSVVCALKTDVSKSCPVRHCTTIINYSRVASADTREIADGRYALIRYPV